MNKMPAQDVIVADGALAKLDNATRALAEAKTVDEIKHVMDLAEAARLYARKAQLGLEAQNHAAEIYLDGSRKAGELLARLERSAISHGGSRRPTLDAEPSEYRAVLEDTGTTRQDANRWQQIASLPAEVYEGWKDATKSARHELTTAGALKVVKEQVRKDAKAQRESEARQALDAWPDWLIVGDFRVAGDVIPDNSVDLIFTDPPYDEDSARLYADLAAFGARVLKQGGICIAYSGQMHLPQIYAGMGQHLEYMWTCGIGHSGGATMFRKWRIANMWKPLLVYGKPPITAWWDVSFDDFATGGREKYAHPWQQAVSEAEHYIGAVCPRRGLVCDPFLGGGTSLVAAKRLGMRYVGLEINPGTARAARQRINEEPDE